MNFEQFKKEVLSSPPGQAVRFNYDTIRRIDEFCVNDSLPTMRNMVLISAGHEPEYHKRFYEPNLGKWCEKNNINYIIHFDKPFVDFIIKTNK